MEIETKTDILDHSEHRALNADARPEDIIVATADVIYALSKTRIEEEEKYLINIVSELVRQQKMGIDISARRSEESLYNAIRSSLSRIIYKSASDIINRRVESTKTGPTLDGRFIF